MVSGEATTHDGDHLDDRRRRVVASWSRVVSGAIVGVGLAVHLVASTMVRDPGVSGNGLASGWVLEPQWRLGYWLWLAAAAVHGLLGLDALLARRWPQQRHADVLGVATAITAALLYEAARVLLGDALAVR